MDTDIRDIRYLNWQVSRFVSLKGKGTGTTYVYTYICMSLSLGTGMY